MKIVPLVAKMATFDGSKYMGQKYHTLQHFFLENNLGWVEKIKFQLGFNAHRVYTISQ